ncbi:TPA: hypothetical protein ACN35K_004620 [Vibrio parahaemolyticus]|uniref:hypothetical protein n=1 Tax=Vibrio parahaemolyticus TaxID=670 RepID=UPI00046F2F97|nr:hypothetical protein [Vibrio parahaemolyticus]
MTETVKHAKVREVASLKIEFGRGKLSGVKRGKGKFTERRYSLKSRLVEFRVSKSQTFALKPRSALVAVVLQPLVLESQKVTCAFVVFRV